VRSAGSALPRGRRTRRGTRGDRSRLLRRIVPAGCGRLLLTGMLGLAAGAAYAAQCPGSAAGEEHVYWGDLHVHTAFSLDAYAFGAIATPQEAYAFARGQPLRLASGEMAAIDRPLDFVAVTEHAATLDVMYLCTDPIYADVGYCRAIRESRDRREARTIFNDYLLPLVSDVPPKPAPLCDEPGMDCSAASASQWRRIQQAANGANEPCTFTALIGYEWTASPGGRHWHRNVVFRTDRVPDRAVDYVHYPEVTALWRELDRHCRAEDGCDVLTIPHNINWADGGPTFDVESADPEALRARARYERLAEVHQEKGNSECLPEQRDAESDTDCNFERLTDNYAKNRLTGAEDIDPDSAWRRMRSTYYRSLLGRGLLAYQRPGAELNPLQLGAIGSTDTHFGTAGKVAEADYGGSISTLFMSDEERLASPGNNPGGLVAVWAPENTRAAIFDALKARRAYGTSGPRITLRFGTTAAAACGDASVDYGTVMGGTLTDGTVAPTFTVEVARDQTPLQTVQIVKGEVRDGRLIEEVRTVARFPEGRSTICVSWQDPAYRPDLPAYWYARVLEQPTPRWSKHLCERIGACDRFPDGDRMIQERAWSSPIWRLP
jgi:hypothetical protein